MCSDKSVMSGARCSNRKLVNERRRDDQLDDLPPTEDSFMRRPAAQARTGGNFAPPSLVESTRGSTPSQTMADSALSKGEQKRQAKQALKEKEKAEKDAAKRAAAAAAPPKAAGAAAPTLEEDEDIDPTKYFENRLAWVSDRKENGPDPYPHKFSVQLQLPAFHAKYNDVIEDGGFAPETDVSIAGRVGNIRSGGKGLVFYDLFGEGQKVQIFANAQKFTEFAGMEKDQVSAAHPDWLVAARASARLQPNRAPSSYCAGDRRVHEAR